MQNESRDRFWCCIRQKRPGCICCVCRYLIHLLCLQVPDPVHWAVFGALEGTWSSSPSSVWCAGRYLIQFTELCLLCLQVPDPLHLCLLHLQVPDPFVALAGTWSICCTCRYLIHLLHLQVPDLFVALAVTWSICCTCRYLIHLLHLQVPDPVHQAVFVALAGTWSICCACRYLIQFTKNKEEYEWRGYMYAALLLVTAMLQSVFLHQYFHSCLVLGMRLRSVIISAVYRKVHCCCCWTLSAVEVIDTHTVLKRTLVLMRSDSFEVQFLLHSFRINYIKDGVIQTCKLYSSRWMYF